MYKRVFLAALLAVTGALTASAGTACEIPDDSLRHLAARMLMVGFRGNQVTPDNPVVGYLKDTGVGAIILFDVDLTNGGGYGTRNITSASQLKELTSDLQALSGHPLLIAADQEGGYVQRLKPAYGWERIPTARHSGLGGPDSVRAAAALAAKQLAEAGVSLNLAPEADLLIDSCPAISDLERAYSADPDSVGLLCRIFVDEHRRAGVATTLKHFPGHGSARSDSHHGFTDVTQGWSEKELKPFAALIKSGDADAIMTAHIFNRNLDADFPASLSHKITTELLRDSLGFEGVVITDDLYMEAVRDNYSVDEFIVDAINAGADLLCVGNNINTGFEADRPRKLVEIITGAVRDGRIPLSRLIESNARIDRLIARTRARE